MKIGCGIIILFILAGCSHSEHNAMIRESNDGRLEAYGKALSMQTTEGGRMALTLTYALGVGQQQYIAPETFLTYATGLFPYASLLTNMWYMGHSQRDDSPSYAVDGAFNSINITNESNSRNTSSSNHDSGNTFDYVDSPMGDGNMEWYQANPWTYER